MDIVMDWHMVRKYGCQWLLNLLKIIYPERELYSISTDWVNSPSYIAKARGVYGDVIVGWIKSK